MTHRRHSRRLFDDHNMSVEIVNPDVVRAWGGRLAVR
jgi:hypothetical protein